MLPCSWSKHYHNLFCCWCQLCQCWHFHWAQVTKFCLRTCKNLIYILMICSQPWSENIRTFKYKIFKYLHSNDIFTTMIWKYTKYLNIRCLNIQIFIYDSILLTTMIWKDKKYLKPSCWSINDDIIKTLNEFELAQW